MSSNSLKPAHPFESLSTGENIISEGSAKIKFPKGEVFYNPVQQFNRDLSISVINAFAEKYLSNKKKRHLEGITILEALSATGLRSIRYAQEIPRATRIIANDMDPRAVELIQDNVKAAVDAGNDRVGSTVTPNQGDANAAMHKFVAEGLSLDVVDLDPYGSAAPFLDTAVQTVASGGLLCVTCTDKAILCSTHPETCFAKYGGLPLRGDACHEAALRLVIQAVESCANRYRRHVIPLMSCSIDFYVRVFLQVVESPANVKFSCTKRGTVARCVQCHSLYPRSFATADLGGSQAKFYSNHDALHGEKCPVCNSRMEICGPMWLGPIHDVDFVKDMLQFVKESDTSQLGTIERIEGFSSLIVEEIDAPLYYSLPEMSKFLKCSIPPLLTFKSAMLHAGLSLSGSHCESQAIKTSADPLQLWKIMVDWIEKFDTPKSFEQDSCQRILVDRVKALDQAPSNFEYHSGANPVSRSEGLKRFPLNPTKNWGPLARAKKARKEMV